jgi:hypothetical protein
VSGAKPNLVHLRAFGDPGSGSGEPPSGWPPLTRRGSEKSVRGATYSYEHMFQSSVNRLRALLSLADDFLGDPPHEAPHPHRRPLRLEYERRPGAVSRPPAHCLSPVRAPRERGHRQHVR